MAVETILILVGIGLFGGALNAVAGGATLLTFPALMLAGLPPVVANATNFVALMPGNAAALAAYRQELRELGSAVWPLLIVSGVGAIVGSLLLLVSDPDFFVALVPFLILFATLLFAYGDAARRQLLKLTGERTGVLVTYGTLFACSIYGGYFGAGLGIILLGIVQIMGYTAFHTANSLKNLLVTSFTALSIGVFGFGGLIAWPEAVVTMCGAAAGGYLGGRYARKVNERWLRGGVIGFGFVLAGVYLVRNLTG